MHGLVCRYPHIALRKGLLIFFTVKRQTVSIVGLASHMLSVTPLNFALGARKQS